MAEVLAASPAQESLRWAIRLEGGEAYQHLALSRVQEDLGEDPRPELTTAVKLLPADAQLWVRLALAEESAGRPAEAERQLLEAAKRSTKHDIRWALANFYFRQANVPEFIRWAHAALENAYGDSGPLFGMCTALLGGGERIRREVLPARRAVWVQYAAYATQTQRWAEADKALEWLGTPQSEDERRTLSGLAPILIENQQLQTATRLWRELGEAGVPLLEWHANPVAGVLATPSGSGWKITLTGDQPERCELLWKVAIVSGPSAVLTWRAGSNKPGLGWEVREYATGLPLITKAGWDQGRLGLSGPRLVRLGLAYERDKGVMRLEGALDVQDVRLGTDR